MLFGPSLGSKPKPALSASPAPNEVEVRGRLGLGLKIGHGCRTVCHKKRCIVRQGPSQDTKVFRSCLINQRATHVLRRRHSSLGHCGVQSVSGSSLPDWADDWRVRTFRFAVASFHLLPESVIHTAFCETPGKLHRAS